MCEGARYRGFACNKISSSFKTVITYLIRIIAVLAAQNDDIGKSKQTDVDGTYLNAPLTETIYIRQLGGDEITRKEDYMCRFNHVL